MGSIEFKQFDVMSVAKVSAAVMAILGFILGIVVAAVGSAAAFLFGAGGVGVGFGVASIVLFPILYAIMGFVFGAISAFLYNIVAEHIGGIRVKT